MAMRIRSKWTLLTQLCWALATISSLSWTGACQRNTTTGTVRKRLQEPRHYDARSEPAAREQTHPIALINGTALPRREFEAVLLDSHGLSVLQQLIGLHLARTHAQGLSVEPTSADMDAEFRIARFDLARAATDSSDLELLETLGQELLENILKNKNISEREYTLGIQRQCYLRKVIANTVAVTEREVDAYIGARQGQLAVCRHIVLEDWTTARQVLAELDSGTSFPMLATQYSVDPSSARQGGLVHPFSASDPRVPELIRNVVFDLEPGQHSNIIHVEQRYHVIKLEDWQQAPTSAPSERHREMVRTLLRHDKEMLAMRHLERQLLEKANIEILDPQLQNRFSSENRRRLD